MSRQQLLLRQELTLSQILRTYGKQFTQITERYSDGNNGRCAMGVIMSYFGWNGKDDVRASRKLLSAFIALTHAGVNKDLVIQLNDCGMSFNEIADYLDSDNELANLK
ncbi:MAG TPA: hypothetical protein VE548_07430 [Nitrososphaeraceae archaeon]|jgi:hypothetical protein|nr:hypothetical protein [Nitrososphaeraceae archaeon]